MRAFRARSGPFEEQLHFTTDEIDGMCMDALQKEELLPTYPEAVRIERFIEKNFRCRVQYEDLGAGVMGCTAFKNDGSIKAVIVSSDLDDGREGSERRVRSTLAHEGGHCLMHPILFVAMVGQQHLHLEAGHEMNLDFKARKILCRDGDIHPEGSRRAYNGRWWEWQANRAIGGLLLPTNLVRIALEPFLEFSAITRSPLLPSNNRIPAERELAKVFDVNPIVVRIRLGELFPEKMDNWNSKFFCA